MRKISAALAAVIGILALIGAAWLAGRPRKIDPAELTRPWGSSLSPVERVLVLGLPFTGKTTFAAKVLTADCDRLLIFDPAGDYAAMAGAIEIPIGYLLRNPRILAAPRFRYAVRPESDDPRSIALDLAAMLSVAREIGSMTIVLDEVGDYRQEAERDLNKLARNGRHDGIVSVYVSQVATDIPRTVRRVATRVYSFLQEDPDDLDALQKRCGAEFVSKVRAWESGPPAEWRLRTIRH